MTTEIDLDESLESLGRSIDARMQERGELLMVAKEMLRSMERPNPTHTASYQRKYARWQAVIRKAEGQ